MKRLSSREPRRVNFLVISIKSTSLCVGKVKEASKKGKNEGYISNVLFTFDLFKKLGSLSLSVFFLDPLGADHS